MDINTSELDHITDKLVGALMRPLQERIVQLEEENRNLQGMLDETNHALALQALATAACGATENAIISPAADDFSCFFVRVKK